MDTVFGQSLQLYYAKHALRHFRNRKRLLAKIKTGEDAEKYVRMIQKKCAKSFLLPGDDGENRPPVTGKKFPFAYGTVENVIYFVPGNGPVSANLYLPRPNGKKFPAALVLCGHTDAGKVAAPYQQMAMLLVQTGFAAMIIDPIGQGDRRQFGPGFKGRCWDEHSYVGRRLFPLGDWTGARMLQDAVSAIDYLETRPEIDVSTLGVCGTSGGGTATTFLTSFEKRITMSAPCCYVSSWERNILNERSTDNEQMPPHALAQNLDIVDFLLARAPVPVLVCGVTNDFFDPRGTRQAFAELKKIYRLLGKEDRAELFFDESDHALTFPMRRKICEFFAFHAGLPKPEIAADPEPFPAEKISCGKLPETLSPHILSALRKRPEKKNASLAKELKITLPVPVPEYYVLRDCATGNAQYARFGLPEEGLVMSVLYKKECHGCYHLPERETLVNLYVADADAKRELADAPMGSWGIDLRGVGEVTPSSCFQGEEGKRMTLNGADYYYSALGLQMDLPLLGGKVLDLLKAVSLIAAFAGKITLTARGLGCIPAMLAKKLDGRIASVRLIDPPPSYREVVETECPALPQSAMIFGGIGRLDWKS